VLHQAGKYTHYDPNIPVKQDFTAGTPKLIGLIRDDPLIISKVFTAVSVYP